MYDYESNWMFGKNCFVQKSLPAQLPVSLEEPLHAFVLGLIARCPQLTKVLQSGSRAQVENPMLPKYVTKSSNAGSTHDTKYDTGAHYGNFDFLSPPVETIFTRF